MNSSSEKFILPTYSQYPFRLKSGEGLYLFDEEGSSYLDLYGGHAVAILGHSNKELADVLYQQANELFFYSNVAPMTIREKAAETLIDFTEKAYTNVFFCNSGAEANENALKLAVQKLQRKKIISYYGGWHGRTLFCSSVTDDIKWHKELNGFNVKTTFIERNDYSQLEEVDKDTACVILEPIQSIAGIYEFDLEYLKSLRAKCDEVGAWLVFDEVQTGVGRVGTPYYSNFKNVLADISTSAKSLANGSPIGALLCNEKVTNTIKNGDLGSTFGAGPLIMAVMKRTLEIIVEQNLSQNTFDLNQYLRDQSKNVSFIKEIRGQGCLIGIEFDGILAKDIYSYLLKNKVLVGTASGNKNTIRILCPLITEKKHFDILLNLLSDFS